MTCLSRGTLPAVCPAVMRFMSTTGCNHLRPPGQEWGPLELAGECRDESPALASRGGGETSGTLKEGPFNSVLSPEQFGGHNSCPALRASWGCPQGQGWGCAAFTPRSPAAARLHEGSRGLCVMQLTAALEDK